jgi:FAD dependent oxidoreductase
MSGHEPSCDVLLVGGGLGGVAAALAATRRGYRVVLTEETDWLGGQLTAQAVPPDEHPWIEQFGCTASYRLLRNAIRAYYRDWYPLTTAARRLSQLNPGEGAVSRLCHEPKVALAVLTAMLAEPTSAGLLQILRQHRPVAALCDSDVVREVILIDTGAGRERTISARFVLDATELRDLLPICQVEHVTGFEVRSETGEPHARAVAQPTNMRPSPTASRSITSREKTTPSSALPSTGSGATTGPTSDQARFSASALPTHRLCSRRSGASSPTRRIRPPVRTTCRVTESSGSSGASSPGGFPWTGSRGAISRWSTGR